MAAMSEIPSRQTLDWSSNPFVRVVGRHPPLDEVVAAAAAQPQFIGRVEVRAAAAGDFAAIDLPLAASGPRNSPPVDPPAPGLGYSGFTPAQRRAYLQWLPTPTLPAPPAFQQLLLANLEVALLAGGELAAEACAEALDLLETPAWEGHTGLARTAVLGGWLMQDVGLLVQMLEYPFGLSADVLDLVLGCLALQGVPMTATMLPALLAAWQMQAPSLPTGVLALRLDSLARALGGEVLQHALALAGDAAQELRPFRCQHRDLRLALPQPALRPILQPLLADMLTLTGEAGAAAGDAPDTEADGAEDAAMPALPPLILEFGHSRSEMFDYALRQAQKQPGFQQLMDEDRHMVYRVPFRRNDMRRFWQLWDCVQGWSSTRIYSHGEPLEKWQVYPYSQYLR